LLLGISVQRNCSWKRKFERLLLAFRLDFEATFCLAFCHAEAVLFDILASVIEGKPGRVC
jgi:hypothetical protein